MAEVLPDAAPGLLQVYVCYGTARAEFLRPLKVAPGTTIGAAIEMSGVLEAYPEINLSTQPVGIYAKKKSLDTVLRERDRIEIYRPLVADPKDSRRKRAAKKEGATPPAP
jgi:putative ubiquitin-RnfH superfamily antitoxin RatB of RatAB toxin-antitoxin module